MCVVCVHVSVCVWCVCELCVCVCGMCEHVSMYVCMCV